ncbi:MAG: Hint domain-containing protein [Rhodobacteraceae bacterium]|nr:Hint domain-containing protein [Paracoccaceae bacterium]
MATETLDWSTATAATGGQLADFNGVSHVVGDITVTATLVAGSAINTVGDYNPAFGDAGSLEVGELFTGGNYTGGGSSNSSLHLEDNFDSSSGYSSTVTATFDFTSNVGGLADGVENLDFWISDIDTSSWDDVITIRVYDLDGNLMPSSAITFASLGSNLSESGGVISVSSGGNVLPTSASGSVNIQVVGPISRIEIDYGNDDDDGQRVEISNLTYEPSDDIVCFAAGTLIQTENGEIAIEDLQAGDLVVTHGNGLQPIRWIGHRTVSANGTFAPICITKGTLGNTRDLLVSPAHRMMISGARTSVLFSEDEVLVPAKALIDGDRIYRKTGGEVTYYHILFNAHEVIFAEGAPTESLLLVDGVTPYPGFSKETLDEVLAIFPELNGELPSNVEVARPVLSMAEAKLLHI